MPGVGSEAVAIERLKPALPPDEGAEKICMCLGVAPCVLPGNPAAHRGLEPVTKDDLVSMVHGAVIALVSGR